MCSDTETLRSAFKYITGETEHICRLCFGSTADREEISMEDSVNLQRPYFDQTITFIDMLDDLGVTIEPYLPQVLCSSCASALKNSYLFKKLCQHSDTEWIKLMARFVKCLDLADTAGPNVVTAYLVVNNTENLMFTSGKDQGQKNKKTALGKLKNIIKSRESYVKVMKKQKNIIRCEICNEKFTSNCRREKHYKNTHGKTSYPCRHCTKVFSTALLCEGHTERVHLTRKIQCSKCSKMFSTERLLRYHDKFHHTATVCKLCFVQLPSKRDLRIHMDKHELNKCPKCEKCFLYRQTFKTHLTICGVTEKRPKFFCDICNKGYFRKNGLKTHLKISHGFGQVLSCSWCGKKYDAISRLKNHIVKHTKERNFHCEQCGGKFVTQAALVYHSRLHTGERPFPCDLCSESFLSASRRMEHKRRKHFGPTKECPVCKMKFVTRNILKKHLERHFNPHSKLYVSGADPKLIQSEGFDSLDKNTPLNVSYNNQLLFVTNDLNNKKFILPE
ncbi:gastrula zinc finger protein XlCGF26.1 [Amyelois transitella]|uniref:gastrula zinc finger protein XlCGF26.1 n=1 Tax=Amyelois transitella TaxID=680683 RepID=UPI00298F6302|nr:gastrula zinc finger protein XlCGF26.1 [Amyelois transitella]